MNRQRMDFLMLLPHRGRVVVELDGKRHYSDSAGRAGPALYAQLVAEDRALTMAGYEVYRFGGNDLLARGRSDTELTTFFASLLARHKVSLEPEPLPDPHEPPF